MFKHNHKYFAKYHALVVKENNIYFIEFEKEEGKKQNKILAFMKIMLFVVLFGPGFTFKE